MAIQAANLTTAAATIFAALVFAAVKAFFFLFFAEVIHGVPEFLYSFQVNRSRTAASES
jgi:hypothetical protein